MLVADIHEELSKKFSLSVEEKNIHISGQPKYKVEFRWARMELVQEGILAKPEVSGRGYWQIQDGTFNPPTHHADEVPDQAEYNEGAVKKVTVNRYERNEKARDACLSHHGHSCLACGFDFEKVYGHLGKNQIHVHHKVKISSIGKEYKLDPISDLEPVCPNCHHMIHRRDPPFSIAEIKAMLQQGRLG